jgi:hypothetical protein
MIPDFIGSPIIFIIFIIFIILSNYNQKDMDLMLERLNNIEMAIENIANKLNLQIIT